MKRNEDPLLHGFRRIGVVGVSRNQDSNRKSSKPKIGLQSALTNTSLSMHLRQFPSANGSSTARPIIGACCRPIRHSANPVPTRYGGNLILIFR